MKYLIRILLFPFALAFDVVTRIRNKLYELGLKPSTSFAIPVICIGNLTVGGTGKTPFAEYLIRLLSAQHKIATLSRGYGRNTKGFRVAGKEDDAGSIGDEPLQLYLKYGRQVAVAVGEDRVMATATLLQEQDNIRVVLLDDAFQHRRIRPSFTILLTDYNRPFYTDFLLPAGRLRESRVGARRADIVVVTKSPASMREEAMMEIESTIRDVTNAPVFFSKVQYGVPVLFGRADALLGNRVLLVTGIGNSDPLHEFVKANFNLVAHLKYRDHHIYSEKEVQTWSTYCTEGVIVLTTEKDMVKLISPSLSQWVAKLPIFYLPIEMEFIKNGEEFDAIVTTHVQELLSKSDGGEQ